MINLDAPTLTLQEQGNAEDQIPLMTIDQ